MENAAVRMDTTMIQIFAGKNINSNVHKTHPKIKKAIAYVRMATLQKITNVCQNAVQTVTKIKQSNVDVYKDTSFTIQLNA